MWRVLVKWQLKRQRLVAAAVGGIKGLEGFGVQRRKREGQCGILVWGRSELALFTAINSLPLTASHHKPPLALELPVFPASVEPPSTSTKHPQVQDRVDPSRRIGFSLVIDRH